MFKMSHGREVVERRELGGRDVISQTVRRTAILVEGIVGFADYIKNQLPVLIGENQRQIEVHDESAKQMLPVCGYVRGRRCRKSGYFGGDELVFGIIDHCIQTTVKSQDCHVSSLS